MLLTARSAFAMAVLAPLAAIALSAGPVAQVGTPSARETTAAAVPTAPAEVSVTAPTGYPIRPVPFTAVRFADAFWAPRLDTNRRVTIPVALRQSADTGRLKNFDIAAGAATGAFCSKYAFDDSDVFKVIEGAAYVLAATPDPALQREIEGIVARIAAAQERDGYLYTARTVAPASPMEMAGRERWSNLQWSHELYNAGHLYEAAVAWYAATGSPTLLDVARRNADLISRTFNLRGRRDVPGHQEIEIGLTKLYRVTGTRAYLDTARFFLDERGRGPAAGRTSYGEYAQDHLPVRDQAEAVGHAVRAAYQFSGMADVAHATGDATYLPAVARVWDDVVTRKLYVTGGIGATGEWEGFGPAYDLPNEVAYVETCASIAFALWSHRLFLTHGDAKFMDVFERTVYNALLSGVALTGDRFFYPNPLASAGTHERSPWFPCACCPSNVPRFLPTLPGFAYATAPGRLYVNLFVGGTATVPLDGAAVEIAQTTRYPWDGRVRLAVSPAARRAFTLLVRLPGWSRNEPVPGGLYRFIDTPPPPPPPTVRVNGTAVPGGPLDGGGYLAIRRDWAPGDVIEIDLPMPARRIAARDEVTANVGRVAVQRGPIVYAAEWPDNGGRALEIELAGDLRLDARERPDLLNGVVVLEAATGARPDTPPVTLIPYYAWAHRGKGEMAVWLRRHP
jgi:hypothetical protein